MLCRTLGLALAVAMGITGTLFGQTPRLDEATKLNAEAVTHMKAGRTQEAIPLLLRVVAIREKDLGPDHPKTADALSNLASAYDGNGDSYAALPLLRRALRAYETSSPNDPAVPVILGNLAALYYRIDQFPEALGVAERALKLAEDIDGPESPSAVNSMANLAAIHWSMGAHAEARDLLQRAIEINESVQPEGYVGNATLLNNLAAVH